MMTLEYKERNLSCIFVIDALCHLDPTQILLPISKSSKEMNAATYLNVQELDLSLQQNLAAYHARKNGAGHKSRERLAAVPKLGQTCPMTIQQLRERQRERTKQRYTRKRNIPLEYAKKRIGHELFKEVEIHDKIRRCTNETIVLRRIIPNMGRSASSRSTS
ncbi:hypothetical protein L228DRAFT_248816 [Xylona heveae TC161]|uniref:Uncharacterized protein n=1 Tax=Xylona heveae (strain CBS 132557 / TC161) TaxID=1328760 RepID=A0A165FJP0_XYLHT|nr:hypothetical protein L228DRAFT_248816 [Xylona heveae TC161]KZF21055.1 hypothetical protein L228DRAFT_248816 [Xylona heveae TC161]